MAPRARSRSTLLEARSFAPQCEWSAGFAQLETGASLGEAFPPMVLWLEGEEYLLLERLRLLKRFPRCCLRSLRLPAQRVRIERVRICWDSARRARRPAPRRTAGVRPPVVALDDGSHRTTLAGRGLRRVRFVPWILAFKRTGRIVARCRGLARRRASRVLLNARCRPWIRRNPTRVCGPLGQLLHSRKRTSRHDNQDRSWQR